MRIPVRVLSALLALSLLPLQLFAVPGAHRPLARAQGSVNTAKQVFRARIDAIVRQPAARRDFGGTVGALQAAQSEFQKSVAAAQSLAQGGSPDAKTRVGLEKISREAGDYTRELLSRDDLANAFHHYVNAGHSPAQVKQRSKLVSKRLAELGLAFDQKRPFALAPASGAPVVVPNASSRQKAPAVALQPARKPLELGIDLSAMDPSVRPQDDFFRHVNGGWLKTFEIPADESSYGPFNKLHDGAQVAIQKIIEDAAQDGGQNSDQSRMSDLYKSFMDAGRIESLGTAPVAADLKRIGALKTKKQLVGAFARASLDGVASPVGFYVEVDAKASSQHIGYAAQSGLGLPDREYYLKTDKDSTEIQVKYREYLAKLFQLAGEADPKTKAEAVYALEKALASHHWTIAQTRDANKTYNKLSIEQLKTLAPNFGWAAYFRAVGVPKTEKSLVVEHPSYFAGLSSILAEQPLEAWKLYLKARTLDAASSYLSDKFVQAAFEFEGKTLSGQPELQPRWKRGVSLVNGAVGELVSQVYVQRHFPPSSKERMAALIENLRGAFGRRIKALSWMEEATKKAALEKLAKFGAQIGYPAKWRDYSGLTIKADDLFGNVRRSNRFDHKQMMARLGRPVNKDKWYMLAQTVNAQFNPTTNRIFFPAAILQPPFFNPAADDAVNYGAIGAVIGHEMSHGFDDQGSKFDGDGMLRDWWTAKDRAEFEARGRKLIAQFSAFEPLPGQHVNGEFTLGENLGDLGGLIVAYEAYQLSLNGKQAPVINGYTGDQRFLMGWAQAWREAIRQQELARRLKEDVHSPAEQRVNGLMPNIPAFHRAYETKPGDKLYSSDTEQVRIW